jgi:lysophospholipase L1-like esterase
MKKKEEITIFILSVLLVAVISAGVMKDRNEQNRLAQLRINVQAEPEKTTVASAESSVYDKISNKQDISILVLGDAIGGSSGVPDEDKWYNSLNKWIYSEYGVKGNLNVATSPLGNVFSGWSDYNAMSSKKYDLAFVCFGENDLKDMALTQYSGIYEALVRNLKANNSKCEVVPIVESSFQTDKTFPDAVKKISDYYNLQLVDERDVFKNSKTSYGSLTSNGILPNKQGYDLYSSSICDLLKTNIANKKAVSYEAKAILNSSAKQFEKYTVLDKELQKSGFEKQGNLITSSKKGSSISYEVSGTIAGISFETGPDCGKMDITLDNSVLKQVDCYAEVSGKKQLVIYSDIQAGQHQIKIEVSQDKNSKSKGNNISLYNIVTN